MKSSRMMWVLVTLVVLTTIAITFGTGDSRSQEKTGQAQTTPTPANPFGDFKSTPENEINKNFPVAIWDTSDQSRNIDEKRQKKNSRFQGTKWVEEKISDKSTSLQLKLHWQIGLPALPGKKGDAVVVGSVTSAEAFLCNNNGSIYSEFSIKIDNVLKDNKISSIRINEEILVDRMGGRVKYPSGRIFTYSISGQEMPRLNGRYVFFLTYDKNRDMYLILTAYEILNEKIIALDGKGGSPIAGYEFEKYNGMSEFEFLNQVRDSINSPDEKKEEIRMP